MQAAFQPLAAAFAELPFPDSQLLECIKLLRGARVRAVFVWLRRNVVPSVPAAPHAYTAPWTRIDRPCPACIRSSCYCCCQRGSGACSACCARRPGARRRRP